MERTRLDQDYYTLKFNFESNQFINNDIYDFYLSIYQEGNTLLIDDHKLSSIEITNREYKNAATDEKINYVEVKSKVNIDTEEEFRFGESISQNFKFDGETEQVFSDIKLRIKIKDKQGNIQMDAESEYMSTFIDLQGIMYSDVKINKGESNLIDSIDIYDLPVVHKSYLLDNNNEMGYFIEQMFTFIDLLKESQGNIDQSEMINVKFYRTHGVSELYNTTKVNLDLKLDIMTRLNTTSEARALVDAIRVFVDSYNTNKIFRYSDLVTDIMNSNLGKYIYNINFRGLNGTFEQSVDYINRDKIYYPEYFNIVGDAMNNIRVYFYDDRSKERRLLIGR